MLPKKLLMLLIFMWGLASPGLFAQSFTVTGKVTSQDNMPIAGASVRLKQSEIGVNTNDDGTFTLSVPSGTGTLVVSYVGYSEKEIAIANQSVINVTLDVSGSRLDDVVVIGYGTVRKRDLTGSVSQIKSKDIGIFSNTSPVAALQGRAAGVQVTQNNGSPGGAISVRIRGTNSVQGGNEPLYVVDGFPLNGTSLNQLNTADIESVEVLKDASAIAIYGTRGANGVVLVTTKKGKKGDVRVNYDFGYSLQSPTKKLDMMNAGQWAEFYNLQAANDNVTPYFTQTQVDSLKNVKGTNWQDLILDNSAPLVSHNITVSGGNDKTRFSVSGGYFKQDGIIRNSNFDRFTIRTNVESDISKMVSVNVMANLARIESDRQNSGGGNRGSSTISSMLSAAPTLTPYLPNGTYRNLSTSYNFTSNVMQNPVLNINELTDHLRSNQVLINAGVTIKPFEGFSIKISGGVENTDNGTNVYNNGYITSNGTSSSTITGSANVNNSNFTSVLSENLVNYTKSFGVHDLSLTGAFTYQDFVNTSSSAGASGFISNVQESFDLGAGAVFGTPASGYSKSTLVSGLGRINYGLMNRYLATVSFRADGSSRYSESNKWGYFPAVALAWKVSEENFLKNNSVISDLKLRGSWGLTGSTAIGAYQTLNLLGTGSVIFGDALYPTYAPGSRLPASLKWETTEQLDLGADIAFLNNSLRLGVDYYIKNTRDLLNTVQLPSSLGYTSTIQNIGEVQNKGWEFSLEADLLRGREVTVNLSGNIAFNRNKVVKLYNGEDVLGSSINITVVNDYMNRLREGESIGKFFGYVDIGYDATGKIIYEDLDKNGSINANDKTFIGDPTADFIYGFNTVVAYKGFELSAFFQGSQGNDIFNLSSVNQTLDYGFGLNMPVDVYNSNWTPTNTNAKYPKISRTTAAQISSRFVEDGSYLRLKNIQLAYNLPMEKLGVRWIKNLQLYASGQNILTITNYSGFDPEINTYGGSNSILQGIDHYSYPTAKSVTFGVRCGF
jgi:TonB-dependent starch-binding outer membrane protein SusC